MSESRFFIIKGSELLLPCKCHSCGAGGHVDDRGFIDLGIHLPRVGVVYFCTECMRGVAHDIGYREPDLLAEALLEDVKKRLECSELDREILKSALGSVFHLATGNSIDVNEFIRNVVDSIQNTAVESEVDSKPVVSDKRSDKPSSSKGSRGVRKSSARSDISESESVRDDSSIDFAIEL